MHHCTPKLRHWNHREVQLEHHMLLDQILAMALTKELTNHSLPEIGESFNGRDHTTVIHACSKIAELRKELPSLEEDYRNLTRTLTN